MISVAKKLSDDIRTSLENRLADKYKTIFQTDDYKCLCYDGKVFFRISEHEWIGTNDVVILTEYADSEFEARKGLFGEDGEMFYIEEMTEDEIFDAIVSEIEA